MRESAVVMVAARALWQQLERSLKWRETETETEDSVADGPPKLCRWSELRLVAVLVGQDIVY